MTTVVAWVALVLALLELVLLAGVVVIGLRFWRQVAPQITPLLAMFTPPPASVAGPESLPPSGP